MNGQQEQQERWLSRCLQIGFVLVLLLLWYLGTTYWGISGILLPNPVMVLHDLKEVLGSGEFLPDLEVTLFEVAVAFALSCVSGLALGYLISRSPYLIAVFEPLLSSVYSIPIILFLPLFVLFFGLGPWSKIALGATISFFPIVLNTIAGFGYVDRIFITAARSMGASNAQMFRYVLLPAALPVVLTGLRTSALRSRYLPCSAAKPSLHLLALATASRSWLTRWKRCVCSRTSPSLLRSPPGSMRW